MRNIRIYLFLAFLFILASCRDNTPKENLAGPVAEQYYKYLLEDNYEAFVDGTWHEDSIRPSFRQELISNVKMYVGQMKAEHQGLRTVELKSVETDTARHQANVFFVFTFGDKTSEQVVVPMVEHDGLWYMR